METLKASEIADIHSQNLPDAVDIHACRQSGVVDLYTLNIVYNKQRSPAIMNFAAIWQKVEVPLDHMGEAIGFRNAQAETILFTWSG